MTCTRHMSPLRPVLRIFLVYRMEVFSNENNTYYRPLEPINPAIRDQGLS